MGLRLRPVSGLRPAAQGVRALAQELIQREGPRVHAGSETDPACEGLRTGWRELQGARVFRAAQPALAQAVIEQAHREAAGEVVAALGPVEAGMRETA